MFDQSIDQDIFPLVQGTARCILLPSAFGLLQLKHGAVRLTAVKIVNNYTMIVVFFKVNQMIKDVLHPTYVIMLCKC